MSLTNGTWAIAIGFIIMAQIMYDRHTRATIKHYESMEDILVKTVEDNRTQTYLAKRYENGLREIENVLDRCEFLLTRQPVLEVLQSLMKNDTDVADEIGILTINYRLSDMTRKLLSSLIAPNGNREPSSSDLLAEVPSQDDEVKE